MPRTISATPWTALTLALLLALLAWDLSRLDMVLAAWMGGAVGFPLRGHWLLTVVLHDGARRAGWLLVVALCLALWWPFGPLKRVPATVRLQLVATTLLSLLAVVALKSGSSTSCPWDLQAFGGVAQHASHWSALADGGPGRCFPAGHASTGFAFLGGYFVFRREHRRMARIWLLSALATGLSLGLAQQLRGAHFMSHTLWTAYLCWCVAIGMDLVWPRLTQRLPAILLSDEV